MDEPDAIWQLLAAAVRGRTPFTALQLATVAADGAPDVRTVILRRFDEAAGALELVSHATAPKVLALAGEPRVALCGYDPVADRQLRLDGRAEVVADAAEREAVWEHLRPPTRSMFGTAVAPGTTLDGTEPPASTPDAPTVHLALVRIVLDRVELLDLAAAPHARTRFVRTATGWSGSRIAP